MASAWVATRSQRRQTTLLVRRAGELEHKYADAVDRLRDSSARAKQELERERADFKCKLVADKQALKLGAVRVVESVATRKKIANPPRARPPMEVAPTELVDGFAETRPMHDGM